MSAYDPTTKPTLRDLMQKMASDADYKAIAARPAPSPEGERQAELELLFDVFWHGATKIRVPQRQSLLDVLNAIIDRIIALESRPSTRAEPSAEVHQVPKHTFPKELDAPTDLRPSDFEQACHCANSDECSCGTAPTPPDSSMRERAARLAEHLAVDIESESLVGRRHEWIGTDAIRDAAIPRFIAFASAEMEKLKVENERLKESNATLSFRLQSVSTSLSQEERDERAARQALDCCIERNTALTAQLAQAREQVWYCDVCHHQVQPAAPPPASPTPPTQGEEGFEVWLASRIKEMCKHDSNAAPSWNWLRVVAREAHHRATQAERQRCAEVCHQPLDVTGTPLGSAVMTAEKIRQTILTPSEQT